MASSAAPSSPRNPFRWPSRRRTPLTSATHEVGLLGNAPALVAPILAVDTTQPHDEAATPGDAQLTSSGALVCTGDLGRKLGSDEAAVVRLVAKILALLPAAEADASRNAHGLVRAPPQQAPADTMPLQAAAEQERDGREEVLAAGMRAEMEARLAMEAELGHLRRELGATKAARARAEVERRSLAEALCLKEEGLRSASQQLETAAAQAHVAPNREAQLSLELKLSANVLKTLPSVLQAAQRVALSQCEVADAVARFAAASAGSSATSLPTNLARQLSPTGVWRVRASASDASAKAAFEATDASKRAILLQSNFDAQVESLLSVLEALGARRHHVLATQSAYRTSASKLEAASRTAAVMASAAAGVIAERPVAVRGATKTPDPPTTATHRRSLSLPKPPSRGDGAQQPPRLKAPSWLTLGFGDAATSDRGVSLVAASPKPIRGRAHTSASTTSLSSSARHNESPVRLEIHAGSRSSADLVPPSTPSGNAQQRLKHSQSERSVVPARPLSEVRERPTSESMRANATMRVSVQVKT